MFDHHKHFAEAYKKSLSQDTFASKICLIDYTPRPTLLQRIVARFREWKKKRKSAQFIVYYSFSVKRSHMSSDILTGEGSITVTISTGQMVEKDLRWVRKTVVSALEKDSDRCKKKRVVVLIKNVMKLPIK